MKKNHDLKIRVSEEQLKLIKEKADKVGMTASGFLRYLGLSAKVDLNIET